MNAIEMGDLLGFAALYDNRRASDPDIKAWLVAIGDLPFDDARAAVAAHYGESTERIMPGHIRIRVKAIRADRLMRTALPAPAAELADQPGRYLAAVRAGVQRIADGLSLRRALSAGKPLAGEPPSAWREARAAMVKPDPPTVDPRQKAREQVEEYRRMRGAGDAT